MIEMHSNQELWLGLLLALYFISTWIVVYSVYTTITTILILSKEKRSKKRIEHQNKKAKHQIKKKLETYYTAEQIAILESMKGDINENKSNL